MSWCLSCHWASCVGKLFLLRLILSKPKLNHQLNSTESEVRLHSWADGWVWVLTITKHHFHLNCYKYVIFNLLSFHKVIFFRMMSWKILIWTGGWVCLLCLDLTKIHCTNKVMQYLDGQFGDKMLALLRERSGLPGLLTSILWIFVVWYD